MYWCIFFSVVLTGFALVTAHPVHNDNDSWKLKVNVHLLYVLVEENGLPYYDIEGTTKVM